MPQSIANYITVDSSGEAQLGRVRVNKQITDGVPRIDWFMTTFFFNAAVRSRTDDQYRNILGTVEGSHIGPSVSDDPGGGGRMVSFYDAAFPPDGFGFTRGYFAQDWAGFAHGPGFVQQYMPFMVVGYGNPFI